MREPTHAEWAMFRRFRDELRGLGRFSEDDIHAASNTMLSVLIGETTAPPPDRTPHDATPKM